MNVFAKPRNRWGWARIAGCAGLAAVLAWTVLAAVLRSIGTVPWMLWSGYPAFSPVDGLELAAVPLLAAVVGGLLEDHDHRVETEHASHQEAEAASAARRKEVFRRLHDAVQVLLPDAQHAAGLPEQSREKMLELIQAALPELDGKGKGELLHFLYEKGLLTGETHAVALKGLDFSGVAFHKAHFQGICLENVDLRNARLDGAHLSNSRLSGVNLSKAFLRHADLSGSALAGSNLTRARLEGTNLENVDLRGAQLKGAFLIKANLTNCVLNTDGSGDLSSGLEMFDQAILVETILPDGRKVTNEKGKEYLQNKEIAILIDRL